VSESSRALMFTSIDSLDLVGMRGDEFVALSHWPNDEQEIHLGLGLLELEMAETPQVVKLDRLDELATRGAGRSSFNLRRDALAARDRLRIHRRAIDAALASAAIFMLAVAGACLLRAVRYQQSIRQSQAQLVGDFQNAFPGWETPASVKSVIQSERRKLAARGEATGDPSGASALRSMQSVLGTMPAQPRFSFDRMVFTDATFELSGRTAGVEALSAIRNSVQRNGWELAQPQAHRDGDGFWSFTLHGSRNGTVASRENANP